MIERKRGTVEGRNKSSAYKDLVWTVATSSDTSLTIEGQTKLALQTIQNPFKMKETLNLTFDSDSELVSKDASLTVSEGKIKLNTGVEGTFTASKNFSFSVDKIHLLVIGSDILGTKYEIQKSGEDTFQTIEPDAEIELDASQKGASLLLRVTLNSATTEISSLALAGRDT